MKTTRREFFRFQLGVTPAFSVISTMLLLFVLSARAQQPFIVDDADVTEKGKFHLEVANEIDKLQASALPSDYQNATRAVFSYGLTKNLEISVGGQFLMIASRENPRLIGGIGDTHLGLKYKLREEKEGSRLPAFAVSAYLQIPTGSARRGLGSGVADFGINGIAQKTHREKNVFRLNAGVLFSGNTVAGALGFAPVRGQVFTGGFSYVRKISGKLQLGGEITGAAANNFQISKGQLQTQFGGNYQFSKKASFDFGIIFGRYAASPRVGLQLGASIDF